jgi:hypothetical protein
MDAFESSIETDLVDLTEAAPAQGPLTLFLLLLKPPLKLSFAAAGPSIPPPQTAGDGCIRVIHRDRLCLDG